MKKLQKWLGHPLLQRMLYLMVLFVWLAANYKRGNFQYLAASSTFGPPTWLLLLLPALLLGVQVWANTVWGWRLLCGLLIVLTFWLANLTVTDIARPFEAIKPLIWNVGSLGFLLIMVVVLAFANWVLLHMKPRR